MPDLSSEAGTEISVNAVVSLDGVPQVPAGHEHPYPVNTGLHANCPACHINEAGQFSAVVDVTGANLFEVEMALQANAHTHDPHPTVEGAHVKRHPIYLVGEPAELDLATMRQVYSKRFDYVAPDGPPADGSHINY